MFTQNQTKLSAMFFICTVLAMLSVSASSAGSVPPSCETPQTLQPVDEVRAQALFRAGDCYRVDLSQAGRLQLNIFEGRAVVQAFAAASVAVPRFPGELPMAVSAGSVFVVVQSQTPIYGLSVRFVETSQLQGEEDDEIEVPPEFAPGRTFSLQGEEDDEIEVPPEFAPGRTFSLQGEEDDEIEVPPEFAPGRTFSLQGEEDDEIEVPPEFAPGRIFSLQGEEDDEIEVPPE